MVINSVKTTRACDVRMHIHKYTSKELKRGNIKIVEKAQETRFGMYPKYSRYIGIAS